MTRDPLFIVAALACLGVLNVGSPLADVGDNLTVRLGAAPECVEYEQAHMTTFRGVWPFHRQHARQWNLSQAQEGFDMRQPFTIATDDLFAQRQ